MNMFITAMYLFGFIQGAYQVVWWHYLFAFLADIAIAGAIGSEPTTVIKS